MILYFLMCLFYLYKSTVINSLSIVYIQEDKKDFIRRWKIKTCLEKPKKDMENIFVNT